MAPDTAASRFCLTIWYFSFIHKNFLDDKLYSPLSQVSDLWKGRLDLSKIGSRLLLLFSQIQVLLYSMYHSSFPGLDAPGCWVGP